MPDGFHTAFGLDLSHLFLDQVYASQPNFKRTAGLQQFAILCKAMSLETSVLRMLRDEVPVNLFKVFRRHYFLNIFDKLRYQSENGKLGANATLKNTYLFN